MRRRRRSDCPIHFSLEAVGDPWTLLVVRDLLLKGRATYSEFLRAEEGIATNILANRLAKLEADGIVTRDAKTGRYAPTARGVALLPVLLELIAWGAAHDPHTAAAPAFVARVRDDREALLAELRARFPLVESSESLP